MASAECYRCHAPVVQAVAWPERFRDDGSQQMEPVDAATVGGEHGGIELWEVPVMPLAKGDGAATVWRARRLRSGERPASGHVRGASHWGTCPARRH